MPNQSIFLAVVNGMVCIEVPVRTKGAFYQAGSYWLPERVYIYCNK